MTRTVFTSITRATADHSGAGAVRLRITDDTGSTCALEFTTVEQADMITKAALQATFMLADIKAGGAS